MLGVALAVPVTKRIGKKSTFMLMNGGRTLTFGYLRGMQIIIR